MDKKIEKKIQRLIRNIIKIYTEDIAELWESAIDNKFKMYSDIEWIEDAMSAENFSCNEIETHSKFVDQQVIDKMNKIYTVMKIQRKQLQAVITV